MDLTDKLKKRLTQAQDEIKNAWSRGAFTAESIEATIQLNSKWVGKCEMISELIEMIEEIEEEYKNE